MRTLTLFAAVIISLNSCIKSDQLSQDECENLKAGLITNNESLTKATIEEFIARLEDQTYSEENLAKLIGLMQTNCSVTAKLECFNCVKTFPPMTEILISISNIGVTKLIDLSYDGSNKIIFVNLH